MNFNSRESYLLARAEWKANYAQLSSDIRLARRRFNESQKSYSKVDPKAGAESSKAMVAVMVARGVRSDLRNAANKALTDLSAMKMEAARQWESVHRK